MLARQFTVYPAIDVLDGRVVRLAQGDPSRVTVEAGDPVAAARRLAAEGAAWLHLVDLDGAFAGRPSPALVASVAGAVTVPLQVGGGFRTLGAISAALELGAARVLVGTAALEPGFLARAARRFGDRLAVAIDVRDGRVAVDGWARESQVVPGELARRCAAAGVGRLLVTSTGRDGSLAGPDLELLTDLCAATELPVIAAGGIGTVDDIRAVREIGCEGVVVGSALWHGRLTLGEAVSLQA